MKSDIKKTVVLGAGTMGAQVAAHLASVGMEVALLDIVPPGAQDRNLLARKALEGLPKLKPSPVSLANNLTAIRPGNFEDDWGQLKDADWVFEAVIEDLEIKRALFSRVAAVVSPRAVVTTNTSGLGIGAMSAHLPSSFRKQFLGTHFFNPPRYLKLLEMIPGADTDLTLLDRMESFCDRVLGKGVVRCKDTPNFIGNRVGIYAFAITVATMMEFDMTFEEIDLLTGSAIGHARSGTFRTGDIVGIDVFSKVVQNLYDLVPHDPEHEIFKLPPFITTLTERKWLGDKTGGGFYRRDGKEIRTLDWKTLEYRERQKPRFPTIEVALNTADVGARIQQILAGQDPAARFLWRTLSGTCLYAAALVPEISDDPLGIDHVMEWGFGWGLGPFRLLDALGVAAVADRAQSEGRSIPPLIRELLASGRRRFYETVDSNLTVFGARGVTPVPERCDTIDINRVKERGGLRKKNPGASLVDLGDGCGLVEFHSKMNALGGDAIEMLATAITEARSHFDALVIGNQGEQFSVGANLMLVLLAVQEEEWDELDLIARQFQGANLSLKYADIPVVVAPFGLTLGGACEVALHGTRVRLSAETYMGLVEVGVGILPAAGGTKELALRAFDRCRDVPGIDLFPWLKCAFETIAFAKVSSSGAEALQIFLTTADSLSQNPDHLLSDAKEIALSLARIGYRPGRPRTDIPALGRPALATFKMGIYNALKAGQISEHDALIGTKVANVLVGGDRVPGAISEQGLLDLEREAFLSLLGTQKTQERMRHMLKEGKPLRN